MIRLLLIALLVSPALAGDSDTIAPDADAQKRAIEAESKPAPKPGEGIEWIRIPGGTFLMGSTSGDANERPAHKVTMKAFEMAMTAVTFKQYRACVLAGACPPSHIVDGRCFAFDGQKWEASDLPAAFQGPDQPVVCIDWSQAATFAKWIGARLPSEAEWEYAARSAGKDQQFPWGDTPPTCDLAVMDDQGTGCGRKSTWPVCSRPKGNTAQGLCDMAGNTWEWVADWYHDSYAGAPKDGGSWDEPAGTTRVYRGGGSLHSHAHFMRATFRGNLVPIFRANFLGFRPVRDVR